tara:strand:+ start:5037 stop:5747 length:711 start_codon:yes stop_codon:yes gene_type:complete
MPRAGNTLLGAILNQTKNIKVTPNSITIEIFSYLCSLKENIHFKNFPLHSSLDSIIKNVFINYYENWNTSCILDRGPWGTLDNLCNLKKHFKDLKFIVLYRDPLECLASFVRAEPNNSIENICNDYMTNNGAILKSFNSIKNIIEKKENHIFITYDEFVNKTQQTLEKIAFFVEEPISKICLNNFKQFNIDNIFYDDSALGVDYHTIKTNEVKQEKYDIKDYLPEYVIGKYRDMKI